ncbi:J domain-containing protein [Lacisediminihabitans sp.]|uniref:J domain-containing protein n=1 Tax=Lacisediminihabitans sp. TaxID=2787631 RepID=UPI00374CFE2A
MDVADAFEVLGVGVDASPAEIETAFKRRARDSHPDRLTGASAAETAAAASEFIRITAARDLLLRFAAERGRDDARPTPFVYTSGSAAGLVRRQGRVVVIWAALLVVASVFCFLGGTIPRSPWNLLLLVPLNVFAIAFARTGRRAYLAGTVLWAAANALVAVIIVSFGSLVALEILLPPVIALIVIGRGRARRQERRLG